LIYYHRYYSADFKRGKICQTSTAFKCEFEFCHISNHSHYFQNFMKSWAIQKNRNSIQFGSTKFQFDSYLLCHQVLYKWICTSKCIHIKHPFKWISHSTEYGHSHQENYFTLFNNFSFFELLYVVLIGVAVVLACLHDLPSVPWHAVTCTVAHHS